MLEQSPPVVGVSGLLAVHSLAGSVSFAMGEHVPVALLQLWQRPVHALLQQTPSTQKFEPHSVFAVQGCPGTLSPQEWVVRLHVLGATQSALLVQVFLQEPPAQANVPQVVGAGVTHCPEPLHFEASCFVPMVGQLASLHEVVLFQFAHAPALQRPVLPHEVLTVALQMP